MHSSPLDKDEVAFFVFKHLDDYSFWNKNVDFSISLFFLDENFEIKDIGKLEANQEKPCRSGYPLTKYVVEGHELLPHELNINVGDYCFPENNKMKIVKGKNK